MTELRVLSASGQLGSGFLESSLARGIGLGPNVIACDGGSTDPGPAYLGSGDQNFSREGTKRDLRLMMLGRATVGCPLVIGSCGTGEATLEPNPFRLHRSLLLRSSWRIRLV